MNRAKPFKQKTKSIMKYYYGKVLLSHVWWSVILLNMFKLDLRWPFVWIFSLDWNKDKNSFTNWSRQILFSHICIVTVEQLKITGSFQRKYWLENGRCEYIAFWLIIDTPALCTKIAVHVSTIHEFKENFKLSQ